MIHFYVGRNKMNTIPDEIENAFYERTEGFGLLYFVNDPIRIKRNEGHKATGCVISLQELEPEQKYNIEYSDGSFDTLLVSEFQKYE